MLSLQEVFFSFIKRYHADGDDDEKCLAGKSDMIALQLDSFSRN